MIRHFQRVLWVVALSAMGALISGCDPRQPAAAPEHVMVGGWVADDGTLFHFRADRSFHGVDCRQQEIWGNWVVLSESRIGFQSLMHDRYYSPQYAIIGKESSEEMDYIVTGGTHFIHAKRVATDKVVAGIELAVEPKVHRPEKRE